MRHWSQLGIRNWRVKPGRTAGAVGAIALGVGVVIWVTSAYESVRLSLEDQAWLWIGRSHLSVESIFGQNGQVNQHLADKIAALPNVAHVTCRLQYYMYLQPLIEKTGTNELVEGSGVSVMAMGIDPATEYHFRQYREDRVGDGGRLLTADDADGLLVERQLAEQTGIEIGSKVLIRCRSPEWINATERSATFTIIGMIEHRRVAKQQPPLIVGRLDRMQELSQISKDTARVTRIDILLHDYSQKALRDTQQQVRRIVDRDKQGFLVSSSEAKLAQVEDAEQQTAFVMGLLSSVALLTGFFIILSTLSMGMVERIAQLGMLRCLGMTRAQTAMIVLAEALPVALTGVLAGIPIGMGLARLSVWLAPEYIGQWVVSRPGLVLALAGGLITTLAGAAIPAIQAMRVSPLAASRPQSQPTPGLVTWIAGVVGLAMIAVYYFYVIPQMPLIAYLRHPLYPLVLISLLYGGHALIMPAVIRLVGQVAVLVAAAVLRVQWRLLSDQVGRAAWRSAAICCGLMVGLSLIVSLVVFGKSMASGWDFPSQFAEAFVFISPPVDRQQAEQQVRDLKGRGIKSSCLVNEGLRCTIFGRSLFHFPWSTFVAGNPDEFFEIANLEFVQGNQQEAEAKLRKGGYILVTPEFTRTHQAGLGDKVNIRLNDGKRKMHRFEIAGVVTSPALQIAANYFNASGMLTQQSVFVVMGTFEDARQLFEVPDVASMFLINFDLPETPSPPEFAEKRPPTVSNAAQLAEMLDTWRHSLPERAVELDRIAEQCKPLRASGMPIHWLQVPLLRVFQESMLSGPNPDWAGLSPAQRWRTFREELVMQLLAAHVGSSSPLHASVRALKDQIDQDIQRAMLLFASVPTVALLIAALGVANLMMANVTSRTRQIAMLRAVGATKWQVGRLVIGEALVLGLLGSVAGVAVGLLAAHGVNRIVLKVWGFNLETTVPWHWVGLGVAFTAVICLIAGLLPARYASRNNIIDAMQTT
ncbi:MAG: FtsX-like permease family protein [Phycisphaerae bacterium]|nr:FtsX-like permease family protein [Phycisphaerae bacterium]